MEKVEFLRRELKMWQKELEEISEASEVGGQGTSEGSSGRISDSTGNRAVKIVDLCGRIEGIIAEIDTIIANEEDSLMRMIINYRCIHNYSWKSISRRIYGDALHDTSLRVMYHRYVNM